MNKTWHTVIGVIAVSIAGMAFSESLQPRYSHAPFLYLTQPESFEVGTKKPQIAGYSYRYHLGLFEYQIVLNPTLRLTTDRKTYTYHHGKFRYRIIEQPGRLAH